jgi:hypothetical protein
MGRASEPRIRQQVGLPLSAGGWHSLRVLARDAFLEVYLDDRWMLTLEASAHPARGGVELTVERGEAQFRDLSLASLPPLSQAVIRDE